MSEASTHTPQRTCIGCRQAVDKGELVRVVVDGDRLRFDLDATLPGRGAYVHSAAGCIESAARGGLNRSFRRSFSADLVSAFREVGLSLSTRLTGGATTPDVSERASHEHGEDAGL